MNGPLAAEGLEGQECVLASSQHPTPECENRWNFTKRQHSPSDPLVSWFCLLLFSQGFSWRGLG